MKMKIELYERLGDIRSDNGITNKEMGTLCDIKSTTMHELLSGKRANPSADILIKLSTGLNVSIDYLLGLTEQPSINLEIKDIIEKIGLTEKSLNTLFEAKKQDEENFKHYDINNQDDIDYYNYYSIRQSINELLESKVFFPLISRLSDYTHAYDFCTYENLVKKVFPFSVHSHQQPISYKDKTINDILANFDDDKANYFRDNFVNELYLMDHTDMKYPKAYLHSLDSEISDTHGAEVAKDITQLSVTNMLITYYNTSNTFIANTKADIEYLEACLKELRLIDSTNPLFNVHRIDLIKKEIEARLKVCQDRIHQYEKHENKIPY